VAAGVTGGAFGSGGRPAAISGGGGIAISGAGGGGGGGAASGAGGAAAAGSSSNNKFLNSLNSNILIGINYIFTSLFIQKKREINFPPKLSYRLVKP
jgi:hypothetical protein